MRERRAIWIGGAALLAIALAVRLWHVWSEPLWLDEAYSAYAADHGWRFLWRVVPRYETHPPFYYSVLHVWVLAFGDGLRSLRMPGILAGLGALALAPVAAREAGRLLGWEGKRRRRLAFAAFALACVSLPLVAMTREVRPYPIMILTYAGAIMLLLRLARRAREGAGVGSRTYAAYLVLLEAMLWLHNMGPLFCVALTLALATAVLRPGLTRADWGWLIGGHLVVASLYLPGLFILMGQAPTWVSSTWLRFGLDTVFFERLATLYAVPGWEGLSGLALLVLALWCLVRRREGLRLTAMLLVLALMPVLLSIGLSLTIAPVFIMRTMTPVAVPALLLLAIGATAFADWRRWIGLAGMLMLLANMLAVDAQARSGGPMEDWYATIAWLSRRFRPGDVVFAYPNEGALPLSYALRDRGLAYPIRSIPGPVPSFQQPGGHYPTGSRGVVSLDQPHLRAIARAPATRSVPTIWLLRLGPETYDPDDMFLDELHAGRRVVRGWRAGPIDIVGLARDPTPSPAPARNPR